jgi:hypothetical protein
MLKLTETHKESKMILRKIKQQEGAKIDDFPLFWDYHQNRSKKALMTL